MGSTAIPAPIHPDFLHCVERQLRHAYRSGQHISDAEAETIWRSAAMRQELERLGLSQGETKAARRFYNHLVARANAGTSHFPHADFTDEQKLAHAHASSAVSDRYRDALKDTHISDRERAELARSYEAHLPGNLPAHLRRELVKHQLDLLDFTNMQTSYNQSEICQYGPQIVQGQLQAAASRITRG